MECTTVDIHSTFGAGFIGAMVSTILYGITTLQTYLYFIHYPKDSPYTKALVAVIWVLDTTHITFMCHCMYYYLITNYSQPSALAQGIWSLDMSMAVNLLIAVLVQTYFALLIFRLSSMRVRWWITSIIMLFVVAHFAFGLETVALMYIGKDFTALRQMILIAAMPFALFAVLSDLCITAALCILLYGRRGIFRRTHAIVDTLIVYAINRCLLTSVVAIVEVIMFATSPNSLWFIAIDFVIGKLFANSFLASLNSRKTIRGRGLDHDTDSSANINAVHLSRLRRSATDDEAVLPGREAFPADKDGSKGGILVDKVIEIA
ncbi:hypothetical protein SERLA73DRAFT_176663 [Serpula lacrymans var. lacrymans S7.3]|uniref:DUF6534 domain-containing protein n=2 Tax=Serpula lacrymans var. lacrymans TaxID=341189 RepID=F8PNG0_SERL3|nr:uncharacterized protein SERLADRAFT_459792 [Serpula lacrymans var. lacrymans S7.9]EGO03142.1 hypothetical protein SERLA73DRAFT_176663 [Serpula lacrymans var. lacrymans S7.3]EGO28910.1 hypothetical protein SERLADRAFT_459792 [Serpula lacrymans var. lacrymans S7.9]